jgi:hypothetical protein
MRITKLLSFLLLGGTLLLVNACGGDDDAATPKSVYILGYESGSSFFPRTIKLWKDGVPTIISNPETDAYAYDFHLEKSDVYAAGFQVDADGNRQATVWKNGVPTTLTNTDSDNIAYSLAVSGSTVYACGNQTTTTTDAILWTNSVPTVLPFSTTASRFALSVAVEGSDLYVGGIDIGAQTQGLVWKNGVATPITNTNNSAQYVKLVRFGNETLSLMIVPNEDGYRQGLLHKLGDDGSTGSFGLAQTATVETTVSDLFITENGDKYIVGSEYIDNKYNPILWKNGTRVTYFPESDCDILPNSIFIDGTDVYITGTQEGCDEDKLVAWKNGVPLAVTFSETGVASGGIEIFVK